MLSIFRARKQWADVPFSLRHLWNHSVGQRYCYSYHVFSLLSCGIVLYLCVQGAVPTAAVVSSAASSSRVLRRTATGQNAAAVSTVSSLHSAGTNSSKGEQNSNSLAGASFPTFCALMSAIAGIVYSAGNNPRAAVLYVSVWC
jgi:hypothetical protein